MMNRPKISIIMGIYNCADTLDEAIKSIINQTYSNWEFIMCDDGSKDSTYEIAKSYEKKYPGRFIVIKNEYNLGLNKTLNKCLKLAKGEYIARMDGDDISVYDRFEKEVEILDNHPEYAIVSSPMIFFDENGEWGSGTAIEKPQIEDFCKYAPFFCHAACMIRREAFLAVEGYTENRRLLRVEDCNLWYKLYAKGYRGYNIQVPLYKMRDDRNASSRRTVQARLNGIYVTWLGFKMLHMPVSKYRYAIKTTVTECAKIIMPIKIYEIIHKRNLRQL